MATTTPPKFYMPVVLVPWPLDSPPMISSDGVPDEEQPVAFIPVYTKREHAETNWPGKPLWNLIYGGVPQEEQH